MKMNRIFGGKSQRQYGEDEYLWAIDTLHTHLHKQQLNQPLFLLQAHQEGTPSEHRCWSRNSSSSMRTDLALVVIKAESDLHPQEGKSGVNCYSFNSWASQ